MARDAEVRSRLARVRPTTARPPDQAPPSGTPGSGPSRWETPRARGAWRQRAARAWRGRRRLLLALTPVAIVALALSVRLVGLGAPGELLVDEGYYVTGARDLLHHGVEPSYMAPETGRIPAVHPPLGKWLIGLGIAVLGDRPVGWRAASAAAGTITVALVYLCGRRLFPGRAAAAAAAFLLAIEHLSVVQSRAAMLDAFLTMWLVAAVYALLRDRAAGGSDPPGRWPRRWRLAAGVLLGCALATKWSAAYALPVAWVLVLWWEAARRGRDGADRRLRTALTAELPSVISTLALLPVGVYVASHAGAFVTGTLTPVTWWEDQVRAWLFHTGLDAAHPYASSAVSWLVMHRPIAYFYTELQVDSPHGPIAGVREVLALGNPLIFLAIIPTVAWALVRWIRGRDHALGVALLFAVALWLPWAFQDRPMFVFYMTPVIPFVTLLQGAALARLSRRWAGAATAIVLLTAALALFWFHWPILTGLPIPHDDWSARVADWSRLPFFHFDWV